ncbi:MAG: hypothetical protein ACRELY_25785 [Polyangiaceae bacterium]
MRKLVSSGIKTGRASGLRAQARFGLLAACMVQGVVPVGLAVTLTTSLVACADENDPKTWVKRLDDPAQRAGAIKRLSQFFEDAMTDSGKKRTDPKVMAVLDVIVDPLTKTYLAGNLDDKTRVELVKSLADMQDQRTAPALAKAFNDFEPGKNDDDVRYAADGVSQLAKLGKATDPAMIEALWKCFVKFQPSKAKSINLVTNLHNAVLAVKSPTYGPGAVAMLAAPVDVNSTDSQLDQLQFWQMTAIQVIKDLKFAPAAKPLVKVLLTPTKGDLRATANAAILAIAKDAEPVLISALNNTDPDLGKMASDMPDKAGIAVLSDSISWLSRPAGKAALLAELPNADTDTNRTVIAQSLTRYPAKADITQALLATYKQLPPDAKLKTPSEPFARPVLAQVTASLYDTSLTSWVTKEVTAAKGDEGASMQVFGLEAAVKLMTKAQEKEVGDAVMKFWAPKEQELYKAAAAVVDKCNADASCYVKVLDQPISEAPASSMAAVKACWMAAVYGNDQTKKDLVAHVEKVTEPAARLALVEAIDHLAPNGDNATADALDKIVASDEATGNKDLMAGDDAVVKVSQRLRARANP